MSEGVIALILLAAGGIPVAIFDLGFLSGPAAALSLAALVTGFALWSRRFAAGSRIDGGLILLCLALSALLCLLGGEAHIFSPTSDWIIRDSVLRDLVVLPWPVHYEIKGQDFLLRAPLGMYLVPAAAGKAFGLLAAHYVLLIQNTIVVACLLALFTSRSRTWQERLLILGVFTFFSGLDILPWAKSWILGQSAPFDWHLETWIELLQYSSHLTQLFWVPHHALAGWAFVAGYLSWRRGALSAWPLVSIFALCLFWSPLAMMGALPFLVFALVSDLRDDLRAGQFNLRGALPPTLIAASILPIIAYLAIDSGAIEKHWQFMDDGYPLRYVTFITVELVLWFWIFYTTSRETDETFTTSDLIIAGVSLLLFPLYSISFSNDFTMRASIPALALVALAAAPRVGRMLRAPGGRRAVLIAGLALAAVTPGVEIARAISQPTIALGNCPLPRVWQTWARDAGRSNAAMTSYIADAGKTSIGKLFATPTEKITDDAPCGARIFAVPLMNHEARGARLTELHGTLP